MGRGVGLDGLGDLAFDLILSKLDTADAARVSCVSKRLRLCASDDSLWAQFCSQDLHLSTPQDHQGNPAPSFKAAYHLWREAFAMYPWPLVKRVKRCWDKLKKWLSNNFPEALAALRRGASESDIQQWQTLSNVKLPLPTRLLYRFHDGQELPEKKHSPLRHEYYLLQVRASAVFVPEWANLQDEREKYYFANLFRMSLLPEGCISDGMTFSSCQLHRTQCMIRANEAIVSVAKNEAGIGKLGILHSGEDEKVHDDERYHTLISSSSGSVEGSFRFFPGTERSTNCKPFLPEVERVRDTWHIGSIRDGSIYVMGKSEISKFVKFFCPKTFTHALKLAKQFESLFDEPPKKHSSPNLSTTTTVQTITESPP
ncbi:hypothetical protein DITRI_Ditri15bG0029800 [Diplodiscus trichospermus]